MKNLHLIPTEKPSNLVFEKLSNRFYTNSRRKSNTNNLQNQNIYITSDEEIKEGDWFYDGDGELCKYTSDYVINPNGWNDNKKIILTTDQDLIADGVQSIDDEFLEWFVKNPTCEYVTTYDGLLGEPRIWKKYIIIPKEKQKQQLIDIMRGDEELGLYEEPKQIKCYCGHTTYCDCGPLEEPKQETLEEAFEKWSDKQFVCSELDILKFGAKWQAEKMYSKEDLRAAWMAAKNSSDFNEWFKQFKKK